MKKCPYCAEQVQDEAIICPHCRKKIALKPVGKGFRMFAQQSPFLMPVLRYRDQRREKQERFEEKPAQKVAECPRCGRAYDYHPTRVKCLDCGVPLRWKV